VKVSKELQTVFAREFHNAEPEIKTHEGSYTLTAVEQVACVINPG